MSSTGSILPETDEEVAQVREYLVEYLMQELRHEREMSEEADLLPYQIFMKRWSKKKSVSHSLEQAEQDVRDRARANQMLQWCVQSPVVETKLEDRAKQIEEEILAAQNEDTQQDTTNSSSRRRRKSNAGIENEKASTVSASKSLHSIKSLSPSTTTTPRPFSFLWDVLLNPFWLHVLIELPTALVMMVYPYAVPLPQPTPESSFYIRGIGNLLFALTTLVWSVGCRGPPEDEKQVYAWRLVGNALMLYHWISLVLVGYEQSQPHAQMTPTSASSLIIHLTIATLAHFQLKNPIATGGEKAAAKHLHVRKNQ